MTPAIASAILALPTDVRRELARIRDVPGWRIQPARHGEPLFSLWSYPAEFDPADQPATSWLPCDPTAILRHAAGLKGTEWRWSLMHMMRGTLRAVVYSPTSSAGLAAESDGPHLAAVAVLAKVMESTRG